MITAVGLTKRFGEVTAVDGLSFEVRRGEVLGLLGPNGAGKTTTVRMLASLISATAGEATVCGFRVGEEDEQIRKRIGVLTEVPGLYENLGAEANLRFYADLYGIPNTGTAVEKYLRMLDLWERRAEKVSGFSKGMKQKVAIARAMVHEPELLFLDEPTSGLDPEMTKVVRDFIDRLHQEGRTILICTHNLDEAERLCDRVAVIRSRLVALDRPALLRARLYGRNTEVRLARIDDRMIAAVRGLSFVRGVRIEDETLIVSLDDPVAQNPALIRELVRCGGEVISVQEQEHSLEKIYLKLLEQEQAP
jgi:ABC-2 type transport system ATP-binding protein